MIGCTIDLKQVDGQRLVVASDIGNRSLVMADLSPPVIARYLKVEYCRVPLLRVPTCFCLDHDYGALRWQHHALTHSHRFILRTQLHIAMGTRRVCVRLRVWQLTALQRHRPVQRAAALVALDGSGGRYLVSLQFERQWLDNVVAVSQWRWQRRLSHAAAVEEK